MMEPVNLRASDDDPDITRKQMDRLIKQSNHAPECTIDLGLFGQEVLVFSDEKCADKFFREEFGLNVRLGAGKFDYKTTRFTVKEGITQFVMILPDGIKISAIIHDTTLVVDQILDCAGFQTSLPTTDLRARLMDYIFDGVRRLAAESKLFIEYEKAWLK